MAAVCEVFGKHPSFGKSISHSHRRTNRRWNPNIQKVRALVNGSWGFAATDVLTWWGHIAHAEVTDAIVDRV